MSLVYGFNFRCCGDFEQATTFSEQDTVGIRTSKREDRERIIGKLKEKLKQQRLAHLPSFPPDFFYNTSRSWGVVDDPSRANNIERLKYVATINIVFEKIIPIINNYLNIFYDFRKVAEELNSNRYIHRVDCDSLLFYDFDEVRSVDAFALVFYYKSARHNLPAMSLLPDEEVRSLEALRSSQDEEVAGIAGCLLKSNEYYKNATKIYKNKDFLLSLDYLNNFLNSNSSNGNVQSFDSDISIVLINRINHYVNGFLVRTRDKTLEVDDTLTYPSKEELGLIKADIMRWEGERSIRQKNFIDVHAEMDKQWKKAPNRLEFLRNYMNHNIVPIKALQGLSIPTFVEYKTFCKHQEQVASSSSSSSSLSISMSVDEALSPSKEKKPQKPGGQKKGKAKGHAPKQKKKKTVRYVEQKNNDEISSEPIVEKKIEAEPVVSIPISVATPKTARAIAQVPPHCHLNYSHRVLRWFNNEPEILEGESYALLSSYQKRLEHLFHGYSRIVDAYIKEYSFTAIWINKTSGNEDRLYRIPGEIHVGSRRFQGLFTYCLGADARYYHRYFTIKSAGEFINFTEPSYFNRDVFSVENRNLIGEETEANSSEITLPDDVDFYVNPHNRLVRIRDKTHNAWLYLYKSATVA